MVRGMGWTGWGRALLGASAWSGLWALASACNGGNCPVDKQIEAYIDDDRDGYGGERASGVCELTDGVSGQGGDCDDSNPDIHPTASEACNGLDDDCNNIRDDGLQLRPFFADLDLDSWGDPTNVLQLCAAPDETWTVQEGDCDDTNPQVNPDIREICNGGIDDDCDDLIDDEDDSIDESTYTEWYLDSDGDGYGRMAGVSLEACEAPVGGVADNTDCDDSRADIHPGAQEICNRLDDDCDDVRDDLDDSLDPAGQIELNADLDGDGFGDPNNLVMACGPYPGVASNNADDCDDTEALANPSENEAYCDGIDNDCNPETPDDADADEDGYFVCLDGDCRDQNPLIHPEAVEVGADGIDQNCDGFEDCFEDADGDGSRTDTPIQVVDPECDDPGHFPPSLPIDCDDTDASITWSGRWERDADGDGFGDGVTAFIDCLEGQPGYVLAESGDTDCNDNDPTIYPGAPDACNDGLDADCDTLDTCTSCRTWLESDPTLQSGIFEIRPNGVNTAPVYCDMETDGGGWTLVASTAMGTLNDAVSGYYEDLTTLTPAEPHTGIWGGLSALVAGRNTDLRFACKTLVDDLTFAVDLSFYDVPWYSEFVSGSDASVCFTEDANPDPTPARRNNLLDIYLDATVPYNGGALVGEDTCTDLEDFTVDFTDAGMDGNTDDGTDWGEDDGKPKCGVANAGEAWFIFLRELPPEPEEPLPQGQ